MIVSRHRRRPAGYSALFAVAIVLAAALTFALVPAGAKEYEIADYDIEMVVTEDGGYLITERITYHFLEGAFSTAHREVPGRGFASLRFISLEAEDAPILEHSYSDGRRLKVEWSYPQTTDSATFALTYEATGALRSQGGYNVIDWNPIGDDWTVGIRDVDITIALPESVADVTIDPAEDVLSIEGGRVHLHRDYIPRRTHYHVVLRFPEVIPIVQEPTPPYGRWVVIGLVLGFIIAVVDVTLRRPAPVPPGHSRLAWTELHPTERAYLYRGSTFGPKLGISATIFSLGQRGKLRLAVRPKGGAFGKDEVEVQILDETGLNATEQTIVASLRQRVTLQKFAQDYKVVNAVSKQVREILIARGLLSEERLELQTRLYRTAILPLVLSIALFVHGSALAFPPSIGFGFAMIFMLGGRLINAGSMTVLSPEGVYLKQQIHDGVQETMQALEALVARDLRSGFRAFFDNLPLLVLHPEFNNAKVQGLKKRFGRLDTVPEVDWIAGHGGRSASAVTSTSAVETVNLLFLALIAVHGTPSAAGGPGGGIGAPGSGAGGGGGGAG